MLLQLAGFIFDCTCIILPKPIVHIDNYCYLYCSTLFIPCTALYFIPHLSYTLIKGHFENKPFIHSLSHMSEPISKSELFCNKRNTVKSSTLDQNISILEMSCEYNKYVDMKQIDAMHI